MAPTAYDERETAAQSHQGKAEGRGEVGNTGESGGSAKRERLPFGAPGHSRSRLGRLGVTYPSVSNGAQGDAAASSARGDA